MPSVQFTTLMKSNDEKCEKFLNNMKEEILKSALKELDEAKIRCDIPSLHSFLNAKKHCPLQWNCFDSFRKSFAQPQQSFDEQKIAIKLCIDTINEYADINRRYTVKSCTIRGFAGCGKSWCMQYCLLHCYAKGLIGIPTSVMSRRSVFLGSKHIDHLFCLTFSKSNLSPYQIAEAAVSKLFRHPEKMNLIKVMDILFIDEIGQLPAEALSTIEIILRRIRNNSNVFMGGVVIISTLDHTQLKPVKGRPFLLSSHVITNFKMAKLETSVCAVADPSLQKIQKIISSHYNQFTENPNLLSELRELLHDVPRFVDTWTSPLITSDTYRLYGRRSPANEATQSFIQSIRSDIPSDFLREKRGIDTQRLRLSHSEWSQTQQETSKKLDGKIKEPSILLFFKGAIYEFTHNLDGIYSQAQMAILFDLPNQDDLDKNKKIKVLKAPTGLHDITFDHSSSKEYYLSKGFEEIEVGIAPIRTHAVSRFMQAQRKQYALKHRVTSTIHSAMGDTLNKVAMQLTGTMFELWDKAQIIVALTRTKLGKNIIFVGDKNETIDSIIKLVQSRSQWTDFMENILSLVTINDYNINETSSLNLTNFPYRVCDTSLPQDSSGYVYFLISIRTQDYIYIGECNNIISRLNQHNSGHGSSSTTPFHRRPYAIMGFIYGFNGNKNLRRFIEKLWKEKRDYLTNQGINDPKCLFQSGKNVICELDDTLYSKEKKELRFIELFKE